MVGSRIRQLREVAGLSARSLSRLAGLRSPGHVASLESGTFSTARPPTLVAIADVLGASLDWLIHGRGKPPTAKEVRAAVERARERSAHRAA